MIFAVPAGGGRSFGRSGTKKIRETEMQGVFQPVGP